MPQVGLLHWALGQRRHCAPPCQQCQKRRRARGCFELRQRLAPGPAIQLGREQQPCHRGLHMLLGVLIRVEGLPQLRGHMLCGGGVEVMAGSGHGAQTPILATPWTGSLPGASVHGILQARILKWVAIPFSRTQGSTQKSNPELQHCRQILSRLSHQGSPYIQLHGPN